RFRPTDARPLGEWPQLNKTQSVQYLRFGGYNGKVRNEAQTRFELIDPMLIDHCGWRREDIRVEQTAAQIDIVRGKGYRRPAGRTDYLLCRPLAEGTETTPLAILEAKHEGLPAEHGLQQGRRYRLGKLHHVPFVFSSNGHQFVEFD